MNNGASVASQLLLTPIDPQRCAYDRCSRPAVAVAHSGPEWLYCCEAHIASYRRKSYYVTRINAMVIV